MTGDYATDLFQRYAGPLSRRRASQAMKVLDKTFLRLFAVNERPLLTELMPGMAARRSGARFGITPRARQTGRTLQWSEAVNHIRTELRITPPVTADLIDGYIRAHVTLMTPNARLSFVQCLPDDLLRVYLRVVES